MINTRLFATVLSTVIMLTALLVLTGSSVAAPDGISDTLCIRDATETNTGNMCTANDVRVLYVENLDGAVLCQVGERIPVSLRAKVESGPLRYDVGLWVDTYGGDALSAGNLRYRDWLIPPASSPDNSDTDLFSGTGPYFNAFEGSSGDACGDVPAVSPWSSSNPDDVDACTEGGGDCVFSWVEFSTVIECIDTNADGQVDLGICSSWNVNESRVCTEVTDTNPSQSSKCSCGRVEVGDIYVAGTL